MKMNSIRPSLDLNGLKQVKSKKEAKLFLESIFRRAGFKMTRFGRESDLCGMLKSGSDEDFSPDFLAMKEVAEGSNRL